MRPGKAMPVIPDRPKAEENKTTCRHQKTRPEVHCYASSFAMITAKLPRINVADKEAKIGFIMKKRRHFLMVPRNDKYVYRITSNWNIRS